MSKKFDLFSVFGIEAEYMIVDRDTLKVRPISDQILAQLNGGEVINEVTLRKVAWSNELVSHVLELKCDPPVKKLKGLDQIFHQAIKQMQAILKKHNAMLLPSAMHPWFDPETETCLWPHGQKDIYKKFDEIFSCKGHGWSNLQSVHINFPFKGEAQFKKLMPAIRMVLPFISYLAASSPFLDGKLGPVADNRLSVYEQNQKKIPLIAGDVIVEPIYDFKGYRAMLQRMYDQINPMDPQKILQHTWLNSRGAITKFDVGAIEIRVTDIGECPKVDSAISSFVVEMVRSIVNDEKLLKLVANFPQQKLIHTYQQAKGWADFEIDQDYFEFFGFPSQNFQMKTFLTHMLKRVEKRMDAAYVRVIKRILKEGNLAKRLRKTSDVPTRDQYLKLAICLQKNSMYRS